MSYANNLLRNKRKLIFILFVLILLFILIRNTVLSNTSKSENISNIYTSPNNNWIINENIMQYSSYIVIKSNDRYRIESLIFHEKNESNLICVLKRRDTTFKLLPLIERFNHYHEIADIVVTFEKVICEFEDKDFETNVINVAIIDKKYYDIESVADYNLTVALQYVIFQIPNIIYAIHPKKQALAHCVHMVYGLHEDGRLKSAINWISLQKELGYNKIRMYFYQYNNSVDKILIKKYGVNGFLEIIYHELKLEQICQVQFELVNRLNSENDLNIFNKMKDSCISKFEKYFKLSRLGGAIGFQEKICANDCYMHFRYNYELITNYDIDELIIPRNIERKDLVFENSQEYENINKNTLKFNLYDYAIHLFEINGRNSTGCLMFTNAFAINVSSSLEDFIKGVEIAINISTLHRQVDYIDNFVNKVVFSIYEHDIDYARQFLTEYKYAKCLYNKLSKENVRFNFNRFFTIILPIRPGKSIFNTNFTEIINPHNADVLSGGGCCVPVSTDLTFVSHYRESYSGYLHNRKLSIRNAIMDIDFLFLLLKTDFIV